VRGYGLRRPASAAEWASYHEIRRDVLLESREFALEQPDEDEALDSRHHPLLLWLDNRPIGTIHIDSLDGGFAALRLVAIDPNCQGRGHGLQLLTAAERFAREIGCRTAVVYATPDTAGFYSRAGYAEEFWDDHCVAGIVQMVKPLR
jgi:N-acetylglutamate synthase-like GNAT family acetyltransferase